MSKYGGQYLYPITYIDNSYKKIDFKNTDFWKKEQKEWGKIELKFKHTSHIDIKKGSYTTCDSEILISKDGCIGTKLNNKIKNTEEALRIISNHINSFLGIINFGGLFFPPFSEKEIGHIKRTKGKIELTSWSGDMYCTKILRRSIQRYIIPDLKQIDIAPINIQSSKNIKKAFTLGKKIVKHPCFRDNSQILCLESKTHYIQHRWSNALIIGWTFLEILLDELWKREIIKSIKSNESERKDRLKDVRTYSAAIRIEFLYSKSILKRKLYNILNTIRSKRNNFIHKGKFITEQDANLLFEAINKLIKITTKIEPLFKNPGWTRTSGWEEN